MKDLKEKAIDIKGKKYVLAKDRVIYFNDTYKNGCIKTKLVSKSEDKQVIVKAYIYPDMENPERYFTGYSQAVIGEGYINKTSALENAETSAVSRALAMMGIGVLDSIASVDEINKANTRNYWIEKNKQKENAQAGVIAMNKEADEENVDPNELPF